MGSIMRQAVLSSPRRPLLGVREAGGEWSSASASPRHPFSSAQHSLLPSDERDMECAAEPATAATDSGGERRDGLARPLRAEVRVEEPPAAAVALVPALSRAGGSSYAMQFVVLVRHLHPHGVAGE